MSRLQTHSINKGGYNGVYSSDQLNQIVNKGRTLGCRSHQSDGEDGAGRLFVPKWKRSVFVTRESSCALGCGGAITACGEVLPDSWGNVDFCALALVLEQRGDTSRMEAFSPGLGELHNGSDLVGLLIKAHFSVNLCRCISWDIITQGGGVTPEGHVCGFVLIPPPAWDVLTSLWARLRAYRRGASCYTQLSAFKYPGLCLVTLYNIGVFFCWFTPHISALFTHGRYFFGDNHVAMWGLEQMGEEDEELFCEGFCRIGPGTEKAAHQYVFIIEITQSHNSTKESVKFFVCGWGWTFKNTRICISVMPMIVMCDCLFN